MKNVKRQIVIKCVSLETTLYNFEPNKQQHPTSKIERKKVLIIHFYGAISSSWHVGSVDLSTGP